MPRKTVKVADILYSANFFLKNSTDGCKSDRMAIATFTEALLHKADAYAGFNYLPSAKIGDDDFGDESRRHYNLHASIR